MCFAPCSGTAQCSWVFHFQLQWIVANTQFAAHVIGMFVEINYTGIQVLLSAIRKHENQAKLIQVKLISSCKEMFPQKTKLSSRSLSKQEKPLLTNTVCQKGWNIGRSLKMRMKCGYFQSIHRDFVWPWSSNPSLNRNSFLPSKGTDNRNTCSFSLS